VAWDYLNPNITYGEITDDRDGQVYKTVVIGTQTWMAQNLNYADSAAMTNLNGNSWCYNNNADSCAKYGRLYTWTTAMNIAGSYKSASASAVISSPHQGVCPAEWHIPTDEERTILENAVGGLDSVGTMLKSTSGWANEGNGSDTYGLSVLPAGYYSVGVFYRIKDEAKFWSTGEYGTTRAHYWGFVHNVAFGLVGYNFKHTAYPVRCLKDSE